MTRELIVDTFAGGGGASTGIEMALGRSPDIAINHDPVALAMHAVNHPKTRHLSKNIWQVDPMEAVGNQPVGLLWASPDCKHFSKAKGGKPVKRNIRDLAWTVVLWAKRARPRVIILENVEEFQTWGPLVLRNGDYFPDPDRAGQTFETWVGQLRRLGYKVEWRELRACDYGAPTIRKRLFLIARRDGRPIVWPEPTHGAPTSEAVKSGRLLPWRTAAEIIDWSLPCPSIFETAEEIKAKLGIKAKRPLAEATMARIARGVKRYVIDAAKPFIIPLTHQGGERGQSIDDPLATVTGAHRGEQALVTPFVTKFRAGATGHPIDEPLHTITTAHSDTHPGGAAPLGVVAPLIVRTDMASAAARNGVNPVDDPLRTQTTAGSHAVIAPILAGVGGRAGQSPERPADAPTGTLTTKPDSVLVAPVLVPRYGERPGQEPRALSVETPLPTIVPDGNGASLVAPHLMTMRNAQKPFNEADKPVHTITAGGAHPHLVAAFLAQHNSGVIGHAAEEPVSTIVQKGSTQNVVAAHLSHAYTSNTAGGEGSPEKPMKTVVTGGHAALVASFMIKYYGQGIGAPVDAPVHTDTTRDRFGLVTVNIAGEPYVIVDIGMRMLTARERFNAQGFPPTTIIDFEIVDAATGKRKAVTGDAQGRLVGNSVCPPLAEALVRANCLDMAADVEERGAA